MPALTRFVLRHKALVALFWVVVAAVGVMTISGTTHRMTNNFAMPGQAFKVDNRIASQYGNGGSQTPYVPVITVPPGQLVTEPCRCRRDRAGVRMRWQRALPDVRIADYATTGNQAFVTQTAGPPSPRSTPLGGGFGGPTSARRSTAPSRRPCRRLARRRYRLGPAGQRRSPSQGHRDHGRGDDRTARRAGHPGARVRQLPGPAAAADRRASPCWPRSCSSAGSPRSPAVSQIVEFLIALIGLGVAIDYSLLVVSRWREERAPAGTTRARC